jgi:hypothetical protein
LLLNNAILEKKCELPNCCPTHIQKVFQRANEKDFKRNAVLTEMPNEDDKKKKSNRFTGNVTHKHSL